MPNKNHQRKFLVTREIIIGILLFRIKWNLVKKIINLNVEIREKHETEKALEELKKASDDESVFKHAGTIMIKSNKKDLIDELEEHIELAKTKASLLVKQEERLKIALKEQETKIQEIMRPSSTNAKTSK